ncbi:MAG: hypothetical protein V4617_07690 [Gemmatimonadota bacterium]
MIGSGARVPALYSAAKYLFARGRLAPAIQRYWPVFAVICVMSCDSSNATPARWPDWRLAATSSGTSEILRDDGTCTSCLALQPRPLIDHRTGPGLVDESQFVTVDSSGRVWAGNSAGHKVYAPDGDYVATVGRTGDGPMEFRAGGPLFTDATGRVHIIDQISFRETIVGADFRLVETRQLPVGPVYDLAPVGEGQRVLVNAAFLDADQIGKPLHILDSGRVVASFGAPNDTAFLASTGLLRRRVAVAPSGYFVVAKQYEYELELYSVAGARLLRIVRPNVWPSPPGGEPKALAVDDELWGFVQDVVVDTLDRAWVLSWEPRKEWRNNVSVREAPDGQKIVMPRDQAIPWRRSRVEVIDLRSGRLIAEQTYDVMLWGFFGPSEMYGYQYVGEGEPQLARFHLPLTAR